MLCVRVDGGASGQTSKASRDPQARRGARAASRLGARSGSVPRRPQQRHVRKLGQGRGVGGCPLPGPSHQCLGSTEAQAPRAHTSSPPATPRGSALWGPCRQNAAWTRGPERGPDAFSWETGGQKHAPKGPETPAEAGRSPAAGRFGRHRALPREGHSSLGPTASLGTWALPPAQTLVCPCTGQCSCPPSPRLTVPWLSTPWLPSLGCGLESGRWTSRTLSGPTVLGCRVQSAGPRASTLPGGELLAVVLARQAKLLKALWPRPPTPTLVSLQALARPRGLLGWGCASQL